MDELDRSLVDALGLADSAYRFRLAARAAGITPPRRFGTEVVARLLGLRLNHPAGQDELELQPQQPATRAEAAYSFAQILRFGAGVVPPGGDELRPAGGGTCVWASAAATKIAGASIATNSTNVFMCQPSCGGRGVVVRLSPDHEMSAPDHEMSAVGALLDVDRRVRERLGYFVVDEEHRASVVLNDLVIVLQRVGKDPQARIRAADT